MLKELSDQKGTGDPTAISMAISHLGMRILIG